MTTPLRYGLIGTGMMGLEHQRNLYALEGADVVAAADPVEESLNWARFTAEGRDLACFADYRELLRADLCDVYVISSPNFTHRAVLDDVMGTGKAIFIEKPLCTTLADVTDIRERARSYDNTFWVGLEYRYMPPVARAITHAAAGDLGRVVSVALREHRHPFLVKVGNWNRLSVNTGGTLVEKCCHFFDLMRLVAGADPVRVVASGGQDVNHLDELYDGRPSDILDNALVIVEFANGVRASLDLSMFAEATVNNEELSIVGDAGKVEAFLPSGVVRVGRRADGPRGVREEVVHDDRVLVEGFHHGASYLEHLDFARCVREQSPALVTADDGWWSVVMGLAAQDALTQRRSVLIEDYL